MNNNANEYEDEVGSMIGFVTIFIKNLYEF